MAAPPNRPGQGGFNAVTRTVKTFEVDPRGLTDSPDGCVSESERLAGMDGNVVTNIERVRVRGLLVCGCLAGSPKEVAGQCQHPGCRGLVCRKHSGTCHAEGKLFCSAHLVELEVDGELRTFCRRCAWREHFWKMLFRP